MSTHKLKKGLVFGLLSFLLIAGPVFATGAPAITLVSGNNIVNASEQADVTVDGTVVSAGTDTTILVELINGSTVSTSSTVVAGGTTFSVLHIDASSLAEGNSVARVTANDGGTPATSVDFPFRKDTVVPTLTTVSMASNSGTSTAQARIGDTVTITIDANEDIAAPTGTLFGRALTVNSVDAQNYTLSGVVQAGDTTPNFSISFADTAGNPGVAVTAINSGVAVAVDGVVPVVAITAPATNARVIGTEVISFTSDGIAPECSINASAYIACVSGGTTLAALPDFAGLADGAFTLNVRDHDSVGNDTVVTRSLTKDTTAPTFTALRTGLNTIVVTFNENVSASDTSATAWTLSAGSVTAATQPSAATTLTLTTSGLTDTFATPTLSYVAAQGTVLDEAGNEVADATNTVTADGVAPTLTSVSIASNNSTNTRAKVGDVVTLSFTSSEALAGAMTTIATQPATLTTSTPTTYTASFTMTGAEAEGLVPFTVNFSDLAGNFGAQVAAVTNGSSVTFDRTAPTLAITLPFADSFVRSASLITFTDNEQTAAQCAVSGTLVTCTSGVTTLGDVTGFSALTDGAFTLTLTDADPTGNRSTTTRNLIKDATTPSAPQLPTSGAGAFVNTAEEGAGFTVTVPLASAGSLAAAGDTLDLLLGGTTFPTPITVILNASDISGGSHTFTVSSGQLGADGAKSITARVVDQAGNASAQSSALLITLDTVAPTAAVTYSTSTPIRAGEALTITATFNEAMDAGTNVQLALSGSNTVAATNMTRSSATVYTFAHTVAGGDGASTVALSLGADLAGNALVSAPTSGATFTVDNTVPAIPTVSITSNNSTPTLAKVGDLITLSFTTSDTNAVRTPVVTIQGGVAGVTGGPTSWVATRTLAAGDTEGAVTFTVNVTDEAGNAAAQATATTDASAVTFDKTAPVLAVVTAVSTPRNDVTPDFTFSSTEAGAVAYGGDCSATAGGAVSSGNTVVTFAALSEATHSNCTTTVTDAAGNASIALAVPAFVIDITNPSLTSITSTTVDGSYKAGVAVNLTANFSEAVSSGAGLTLTTNAGAGASCTTAAITAATSASCSYTVAAGDTALDLDVTSVTGTITDAATNAVANPAIGTTLASARAIVIDTTAPTVLSVATAKPDGFYKAGEVITFTVTMSEPVVVTGVPKIALNTGSGGTNFADVTGGSGTASLTLTYTVAAGHNSTDLDYDTTGAFGSAGTITDIATNVANRTLPALPNIATTHAIVIDTTAPTAPTSAPTASAGPIINAAEHSAGFTVVASTTGSGAVVGDTLELLLGSSSFPTALTRTLDAGDIAAGGFTFTVTSGQLGADGVKSVTARVTDQALNVGPQSSALALTLDTTAPAAPVVTSIADNNKINASEKNSIIIIGTAEANSSVSITLADQNGNSKNVVITATAGGAYSATIDGSAATAFVDGVIAPSVTATDLAGNVSPATLVAAVVLDTVPPSAPTVSLTNPINIANAASAVVSGTGEGNTTATFIVTDSATGQVANTSTLSALGVLNVTGVNLSGFVDGTVTVAVSLTDDVGNISATSTATATKDTVTPVFSAVAPASSAFINSVSSASDVGFTTSEALSAGSVVFTQTSGSVDASSPHICTLAGNSLSSGAHTLDVTDSANGCATSFSLVDGALYSIAFGGTDVNGNPSATTTRTNVTFDVTNPTVTFTLPLSGTTITSTVTLTATTSEASTCSSVLDGGVASAFSSTGGVTHSKTLSGLSVGSHTLAVSCDDQALNNTTTVARTVTVMAASGTSATSLTSNVVLDSVTGGQADLPSPITAVALGDANALDLAGALSLTSNGTIEVGGVFRDQSAYTGGSLTAQNLLASVVAGEKGVTLTKAVRLSNFGGEQATTTITNGTMGGVTLEIPNGTTIFGESTWDGLFIGPRSVAVTGTAPSGFAIDTGGNFEFGSTGSTLVFDNPVTLQIPLGIGGNSVAYLAQGTNEWVPITTICSGTFAAPVAPTFASQCKIANSSTIKIVTWHLTKFASMHLTSPASGPGSTNGPVSSGGGGGGGGGGVFIPAVVTTPSTNGSPVAPTLAVIPSSPTVLGASTFRFTRNLSIGVRGADVTELQKRMAALGFLKVSPTGYFGPATKAAVIAYQKAHKIVPASGLVGPLTRASLNK